MGATQVLRPDARREAIFDIIGVIDHFFFAVEGRDCHDGAEDFFAIRATRDRQTGDHRRRKEIPVTTALVRRLRGRTTECDFAAFFLSEIDVELDFVELRPVYDCALLGFLVERIAQAQLCRSFYEAINEIFVSRALDEYARTAQTNLSLVCE